MKKTIIALLALAGAAGASEDTVTWKQLTLDNSDIVTQSMKNGTLTDIGNARKVTIDEENGFGSLTNGSAALGWSENVTLDQSWKLTFTVNSRRSDWSNSVLFSTSASIDTSRNNNNYTADGYRLAIKSSEGALALRDGTTDLEASDTMIISSNTPIALTLVFLAKQDSERTDLGGTFLVYVGDKGENGDAVISYDVDERVTFTENSTTRLWTNDGSNGNEKYSNIALYSGGVVTVPEPATATLSLLALAGLAARRRRASR